MKTAPSSTESQPGTPPPPRRRFGGLLWSIVVVGLPAVLLGLLAWTLATDRGTAWVLAQLRMIEVEQPRGSLLSGFSAQRIIIRLGTAPNDRVVIDAPRASALELAPSSGPHAWLRVHLAALSADRVSVQLAPNGKAPKLPDDLRLPVELEVGALQIGRLELPGLEAQPLREVRSHVHLGGLRGSVHRVEALSLAIGPLQIRGQARIGSDPGLPLRVQLEATQATDAQAPLAELPPWARALRRDWNARVDADGPLARFEATLALRAQGQSLDLQAEVAPLEPWPLPRLSARTRRFDVSAVLAQAPGTALSGDVQIAPVAGQAGMLSARAHLTNERPGRWDQQRLPARRLIFDLRAQPDGLAGLKLANVEVILAGETGDAGAVRGSGEWNAGAFSLRATLAKVQPGQLAAQLAAMTLSGSVKLAGRMGGQTGGQVQAPGSAPTPQFDVQAELDGHLNAQPARAALVKLAASVSAQRVDVRELQVRSGAAQLAVTGSALRGAATAPWRVEGKAQLRNFDPLTWFPGAPQSAWRRGPHRFNGETEFALNLPDAAGLPNDLDEWLEWLPGLHGQARLALQDSLLAGVALRCDLALQSVSPTQARLTARVNAGGNTVNGQGRWTRGEAGRDDEWEITLSAPQLGRLAPLQALVAVPSNWATPSGAVDASAKLEGRWPGLRAQGRLKAEGLRVAEASVAHADVNWSYSGQTDAPFVLYVELGEARWGENQVRSARLDLRGAPTAHTLELRAELNAMPPAWTEALIGNRRADDSRRRQTRVQLEASGGLQSGPTAGVAPAAQWSGTLKRFELRSGADDAAPLARVRDLGLEVQAGNAEHPPRLTLQEGRGELLGAVLRWERVFWQGASASGPAQLDVKAELEAFAVAPVLARAQPYFGWGGDLQVGGHVLLRSAPTFGADIVLERVRGDLSVSTETETQALQLTDLRLALNATEGAWSFTQALAGKTLGVAAGAVTARVAPDLRWLSADTPIQGVLEARVANLGTWGAWVPPGWRLAGSLRTSATISGRLGAPEYTGEVQGSGISVRNLVEGVDVTDGDIAIALQGADARIERFRANAGSGSVRLEGGASLGEAPKAELRLVAEKFRLLGRGDRRIVTSGSARLQLDARSVSLDGRFGVDEGLIEYARGGAPSLSADVHVTGRPGAAERPLETVRATTRNVALDLQVDLGDKLRLRGRGLDTLLRGDLRLTAPGGKLEINGTVRAVEGTYSAYGQKLNIDRGELAFTGTPENPRLDIIATRPNLDQPVGVAVTGTVLNPRVRLFSEPEMADIDKLSWLLLGRPSDGLESTNTALLQRAALGLLAGEGTGPTDQLIGAFGLDEVSFRQTEGEVRATVISLGKQLSRSWYVGYERSLNATTGNWQLIYRVAQRLTLRAQSGLDNSLDAIWTWRWQ